MHQPKQKSSKAERAKASRKKFRRDEDPSDSSDTSSSDDSSDDSSDSSDDSPDEGTQSPVVLPSTAGAGTTMLTLRPYVNSSMHCMFDEKASISDQNNWWEKFTNMSVQGGWASQVKIRELKMKITSAVRNWRGQLPKHVQSSWKNPSAEFRREYLKSCTSELERYSTMRQKLSESAEFLLPLPSRAGIKHRKSKKKREEDIKRFFKNLKGSQLKVVLHKQPFKDLEDLVYVLKQDRDAVVDGYDSLSSQKRDFRTDNTPHSRHRPKGRAFVGLSEDEAGWDFEGHVRFEDEVEEAKPQMEPKVLERGNSNGPSAEVKTHVAPIEQHIHNAMYQCRMETTLIGIPVWVAIARPGWQSPRPNNPDRNEFCEKCMRFGHKAHNCWMNLVCERCGKSGHPDHACRARPCPFCNKCHQDKFQTMGTVKNLARNGVLKGVPSDILKKLLDEKADPGKSLNYPLEGDLVRVRQKRPQGQYVFAYVGKELGEKKPDNQQCMTMNQDDPIESVQVQPDLTESESPAEFSLQPGQRYGWWENHETDDSHDVAMVYGAVNDERANILLDSGQGRLEV
ncbi:LOW QUALITY PROTEIN: hypothetical protein PHMEG_00023003 [Phytophthora megakarya]|uniref:CCHC-type domain-containing protein n=1 Tax=Phytophthora megakarya TaxID=4795 RepID=A0A225VJ40_9STRA|nr:LOW QUALITY PROTEIN: hypothetical protein PHMEG_00023003 [Phytophthora megakarya]